MWLYNHMHCIPSMIDSHGFPLLPFQHPQQTLHSIHRVILESGERVFRVLRTRSLYRRLTDGNSLPGRFPKKTNQETNESVTSFRLSQPHAFPDCSQRTCTLSHEMAGKKHDLSELLSSRHDPLWLDYKPSQGKQSII